MIDHKQKIEEPFKILVVDDTPQSLQLLTRLLRERGYVVHPASDGFLALQIVTANKPDLILLDVKMPGVDGYEVCRRLKSTEQNRRIPVIFISALGDAIDKIEGFKVGGLDYITKPFEPEEVLARVAMHLNLRCMQDRLQKAYQQMEAKVQERTVQLERANQALRESERRFKTIFEEMQECYLLTEMDGTIILVNPATVQALGYGSPEELIGKDIAATLYAYPQDREKLKSMLRSKGRVQNFEIEFKRKNGERLIADNSIRLVSGPDGQPLALEGLFRDTTERKRQEETLKRSEERYALAQRAGNIGSWDWNIKTGSLTWSDTIEPMFGFAPGQFGQTYGAFLECVHPDDRRSLIDAVNACVEANRDYAIEHRIVWPDGSVRWVAEMGNAVRDADGKAMRMLGIVQDITDRMRAEEELKKHRDHLEELVKERTVELTIAKEQAEAGSRAKSDFLARMSHEIRTPINAVIGLTNVVLKSELMPQQRGYLNKVRIASKNLLEVINDILDFSKVEAGRLELEHVPFNLDEVMEQLNDLFSDQVAKKDLELIFAIAPEVPRQLTGDPGRLTQVLTNLVQNAIKFSDSGEIVIRVELEAQISKHHGPAALTFSVRDTGIGIAADVLPMLFEPFTQADVYLTRSYEGTGLGLAICRRLVELMEGRIWAESTPGKGSTFAFKVLLKARAQKNRPLWVPSDLRGLKILVVDDSALARQVLGEMLRSVGFHVSAVDGGEMALAQIRQAAASAPYQLVLVDWKMPGLDGFETARRIRALQRQGSGTRNQEPRAPIMIMVTAYGREIARHRIDTAPVDSLLQKPVKASELFNAILELFNQKVAGVPSAVPEPGAWPVQGLAGRRLLLVEDSELNRDVAVALLEEMDLWVEVVENGQIAVDKLTGPEREKYDAVLMDIQMPIMDGYQATRRIRAHEAQLNPPPEQREESDPSPNTRIPIIALTAHALKGEKEKCLAAGMDDYIAKPIDEMQLAQVLFKWMTPGAEITFDDKPHLLPADGRRQPPDPVSGLDIGAALEHLRGNKCLLIKILTNFHREFGNAHETISRSLASGDAESARQTAHKLKGAAGNICAMALWAAATDLEKAIGGQGSGIEPCARRLKEELQSTLESVSSWLAEEAQTEQTPPAPATGKPQWGALQHQLRQLADYLQGGNMRAVDTWQTVRRLLKGTGMDKDLVDVERRMDRLDFGGACRLIKKISRAVNVFYEANHGSSRNEAQDSHC